jgi:pimeloyl-ACP methyl ester carboxylesterase
MLARFVMVLGFAFGLLTAGASATIAATEQVVEIPTRPGVTVKFILRGEARGNPPIAILFAGGGGIIRLNSWDGIGNPVRNFLVRTRKHWVKHDLLVAVPDAPSDKIEDGMFEWRTTTEHAVDIDAIIEYLRRYSKGPVFLVGTSRGTISAAGVAARLNPERVAGIVLTSTVTKYNRGGNKDRVQTANLLNIRVPVLLAHHRDDGCYVTPFEDIPALAKEFASSPTVGIKAYSDRGNYRGGACGSQGAHGFRGIEKRVVRDIAEWIHGVLHKRPFNTAN